MKNLIITLLASLSFSLAAGASELTPVEVLIKQGMQVKMGELTGAGSKFSLKNLQGLVLPEGVLLKSHCTGIVVNNSADPKISDIVRIKVQDIEIDSSEFVGFVVK